MVWERLICSLDGEVGSTLSTAENFLEDLSLLYLKHDTGDSKMQLSIDRPLRMLAILFKIICFSIA